MPIHLVATAVEKVLSWETYPTVAAAIVAVIALKRWSAGVDLLLRLDSAQLDGRHKLDRSDGQAKKEANGRAASTIVPRKELRPRDLHGSVIVIAGGFTSQGLLVCSQLSSLGAQLILLTPSMRSERTLQLVHLLRDGTSNPLIYAEECDITSLSSIEAFAAMWNLGEGKGSAAGGVGAGPAGGLSGSTGLGASAPGSNTNKDGTGQDATAPRRIDALVFLPLDEARHCVGEPPRKTDEDVEIAHAEMIGRFHLTNLLLPSMLLLPPHRDVRIVSLLSPWYAAGIADVHFDDLDLAGSTGKKTRWPARSPWRIDGVQTLLWLSLSRELQRRIQLMADADKRPRTRLPGIDDTGRPIGTTPTNINLVNICSGFERGRDVLDYLLPTARFEKPASEEELRGSSEKFEEQQKSSNSAAVEKHEELRKLINPKQQSMRKRQGKGQSFKEPKIKELSRDLDQQLGVESGGLIKRARELLGLVVVFLFWPLAWLLCKSPKRAAETVTWATVAPIVSLGNERAGDAGAVERNAKLISQAIEDAGGAPVVVPGELHREGKVVHAEMPPALRPDTDGPQKLWDAVEARAKTIVTGTNAKS